MPIKTYSHQFDLAGNRTSQQIDGVVDSAVFNNANRITGTSGGGKLLVSGSTDEPAKVKINGGRPWVVFSQMDATSGRLSGFWRWPDNPDSNIPARCIM